MEDETEGARVKGVTTDELDPDGDDSPSHGCLSAHDGTTRRCSHCLGGALTTEGSGSPEDDDSVSLSEPVAKNRDIVGTVNTI